MNEATLRNMTPAERESLAYATNDPSAPIWALLVDREEQIADAREHLENLSKVLSKVLFSNAPIGAAIKNARTLTGNALEALEC